MHKTYDLIVIGAGSAGLTAVQFAAKLGINVALVEKGRIGGDCTWTGCVPSKALLQVAKITHTVRKAAQYGIIVSPPQVDMVQVRAYVQNVIAKIYQHETPQLLEASGVDVIQGAARFEDAHTIRVGEKILTAKKFIIATGARPIVPPIPGLEGAPYQTYEQFFNNDELPQRLLVLGAGSTGVELAQAYGRLGSKVTLIDKTLLPSEDPDVRTMMKLLLVDEGVQFVTGLASRVQHQNDEFIVQVNDQELRGDLLLVATGRSPNVHDLDLEKAGVGLSEQGVEVDEALHTNARHIFAAGDCVQGSQQFTHFAGWQGFQAARNALLPGSSRGFSDDVPRVIYTDPEIAEVGQTESEARQQFGDKVRVTREQMDRVDRAITDNVGVGFVKIVHKENGRLLGATIVSPRAGEIITEFTLALKHGLKIRDLAEVFHAYPTYSMGVQMPAASVATDDFLSGRTGKLLRRMAGGRQEVGK